MKPILTIPTREFSRVFAEYAALSKRSLAENLNQKAYSICLSAYGGTKKATPAEIRKYLSGPSKKAPGAPVAAVIINAKRKRDGLKGLHGAAMKAEVDAYIKKQSARTNFMRAGWFGAIGDYAGKIGKTVGKSLIRMAIRIGKKGGATVARPGISPWTEFWNTSFSKKTTTNQGLAIANEGLSKAMIKQMADMKVYIARKRQEEANRAFAKLGRIGGTR